MSIKIAVITPTIPERASLMKECRESVRRQTVPCTHFTKLDSHGKGCAAIRNEIVKELDPSFDWLAFLDDDDILFPHHLKTLADVSGNSDIVYSNCETQGWKKTWQTKPFDAKEILKRNYIPVTVLMRRSLFESKGGFRIGGERWPEDWDLWCRCLDARWAYIPEVTWIYRRMGDSMLVRGY